MSGGFTPSMGFRGYFTRRELEQLHQEKIMSKQIFGYTPTQPAGDDYVKFCAVMGDEDGNITISVRNTRGGINDIVLPAGRAVELAEAIERHVRP